MVWGHYVTGLAALALGIGTGAGISDIGGDDKTADVVTRTVKGARDYVTVTETVRKRVTVTKTETITLPSPPPPPPDDSDDSDDVDGDGCSDSYEGACLEPDEGYNDVDCDEISDTDFDSVGYDPYDLDRDYDGIACES